MKDQIARWFILLASAILMVCPYLAGRSHGQRGAKLERQSSQRAFFREAPWRGTTMAKGPSRNYPIITSRLPQVFAHEIVSGAATRTGNFCTSPKYEAPSQAGLNS